MKEANEEKKLKHKLEHSDTHTRQMTVTKSFLLIYLFIVDSRSCLYFVVPKSMTLDGLIYALVAVIPFNNKYMYLYSVVSLLTLLFCDRHLIINYANIQTTTATRL